MQYNAYYQKIHENRENCNVFDDLLISIVIWWSQISVYWFC